MSHVYIPSPPLPGFPSILEQSPDELSFQNTDFRTYLPPWPPKEWNASGGYFNFGQSLFQHDQNPISSPTINPLTGHPPLEDERQELANLPSGKASSSALLPSSHHVPKPRSPVVSAQYKELLSHIEDEQEELRDARDELVGSRFRLRTKRRELGATHIQTVTQAGVGIDLLKRYLLENNIQVPENIASVLSDVDNLRDSLGKLEVEYEEAEEKYTLEEWRYTQKESKFVESLSADRLPENPPTESFVESTPTEYLQQHFQGPPHPMTVASSLQSRPTPQNLQHALTGPIDSDMPQNVEANPPSTSVRSDTIPVSQGTGLSYLKSQSKVEQDLHSRRLSWSDTFKDINSWLWKALESSSLERQRLNGMLVINDLSEDAMLRLVRKYWDSDIPKGAVLHTGDTTKSPEATSDTTSVSPMTQLFDSFALETSDAKVSSALPLLQHERVVDALEPVEFPAAIEPKDLVDVIPKDFVFMFRYPSPLSVSTQPTTVTHTSSGVGDSAIPIEENGSFTSSEDLDTIRQGEPTDMGRSRSERQNYGMAHKTDIATSVYSGRHSVTKEYVMTTHEPSTEPFDNLQRLDRNHNQPIRPIHTVVRSHLSDGEKQLKTTIRPSSEEKTTAFASDPYNIPPSSPKDTLGSPATEKRNSAPLETFTRIDSPEPWNLAPLRLTPYSEIQSYKGTKHRSPSLFEPFIRIDSPEPWNLPLLRLTPYLDIQPHEDSHRLEYLPFVSIEDWSSQLPGPSKLPVFFSDIVHR